MAFQLTNDEITIRCQDLVYQVAYAFYDAPYIILLKLLVHVGVASEKSLADICGLHPNDLRKYMGTLHVHRLVKRQVNKEKHAMTENQARFARGPKETPDGKPILRMRDVIYWYLDYREFADVVKYRIAMMRKGIDEKVKQDVGHRGYICPNCRQTYDPLDLSHLFNPSTNSFTCENCHSELVEHDPYAESSNQDKMQAFNIATQPIRDALKNLEGLTLPSVNIMAWLAQNVVSEVDLDKGEDGGEDVKFKVVLGGEEKDQLELARLQEAQRVQNALPVWHTHSTVTGTATSLGLANNAGHAGPAANGKTAETGKDDDDEELAAHYATLAEGEDVREIDDLEEPGSVAVAPPVDVEAVTYEGPSGKQGKTVNVNGVPKRIEEITEEDQEMMTPEEYQAYYEAELAG